MKTYIVTINTKSAHIVHEVEARNVIGATIKAVLQFHHLGAKLSNIATVEIK